MLELEITREGRPYRNLLLGGGVFVLGRQEGVEIHLDDKEVSRRHARLIVDDAVILLEDLDSGNGTILGGRAVRSEVIRVGDAFEISPFVLTLKTPEAKAPAPATPPEPKDWLEIVDGPGTGQRYELRGEALGIGRHEDQDIRLPDNGVGRSHAMILRRGESWQIRDNGSVNGVMMGGERVTERVLRPGDEIRVGNTTLRYDTDRAGARPAPSITPSAAGGGPEWVVPVVLLLVFVAALAALVVSRS